MVLLSSGLGDETGRGAGSHRRRRSDEGRHPLHEEFQLAGLVAERPEEDALHAGLRRVARHGDGWLASAYNITPERFREAAAALPAMPNGLATAWLCVTEDAAGADRVLADVLSPLVGRPVEELRSLSLPIGPAEVCAERMRAFAEAGVQRVFLWPLRDEARQLELFMERVAPLV